MSAVRRSSRRKPSDASSSEGEDYASDSSTGSLSLASTRPRRSSRTSVSRKRTTEDEELEAIQEERAEVLSTPVRASQRSSDDNDGGAAYQQPASGQKRPQTSSDVDSVQTVGFSPAKDNNKLVKTIKTTTTTVASPGITIRHLAMFGLAMLAILFGSLFASGVFSPPRVELNNEEAIWTRIKDMIESETEVSSPVNKEWEARYNKQFGKLEQDITESIKRQKHFDQDLQTLRANVEATIASQVADIKNRFKDAITVEQLETVLDKERVKVFNQLQEEIKDREKGFITKEVLESEIAKYESLVDKVKENVQSMQEMSAKQHQQQQERGPSEEILNELKSFVTEQIKQQVPQTAQESSVTPSLPNEQDILEIMKAQMGKVMKSIIETELERFAADRIGMADYALFSAGGRIEMSRTTEQRSWWEKAVHPHGSSRPPSVIIQAQSQQVPGECWGFEGSQAHVTIRLSKPIVPKSFTLEHLSPLIAYNRTSAPRDFRVWGYTDDLTEQRINLGEFTYDLSERPIQTFRAKVSPHRVALVELEILSNHGNHFTCVYRFRVHDRESEQ
eukprot:GILJ01005862.1.p1 GENE.GILJ01005862.1~~GILJ01005862.1.p1  ORF type:complete len:563 (+),score=114.37 GILJ01005862.1:44-1732(+)